MPSTWEEYYNGLYGGIPSDQEYYNGLNNGQNLNAYNSGLYGATENADPYLGANQDYWGVDNGTTEETSQPDGETTGGGQTTGGGTPPDPSKPAEFINALLTGVNYGALSLKGLVDKFKQAGYTVWVDSNGGARGLITDPSGKVWNVLDPQEGMDWWNSPKGTAWNVREYVGGGGGGTGAGGTTIDPSYLEPWTETTPDTPTYQPFVSPGDFQAPTAESIYDDPSYQLRINEGIGQLENRAAARGILNSGGTLKDLVKYNQGFASNEYSNIWNRKFDNWNADWGNALTQFRADKDVTDSDYSNKVNDWTRRRDTFYMNQSNPWSKIFQAAQLGA